MFTSTIYKVLLTSKQISEIALNNEVAHIEFVNDYEGTDYVAVNDARTIIGGNTFINAGYTGSGIRVGLIESGHPRLGTDANTMGSDGTYIEKTNGGSDTDHATMTCGIIKRMAPSCSIYTRTTTSLTNTIEQAEWLIANRNVHVINISYGAESTGAYNTISRSIDQIVNNTNTTIVVAAGNLLSGEVLISTFVNQLGMAPNAITVGAVTSSGTNPAASGAYSLTSYSLYREESAAINKPDICAPGNITIYTYTAEGTSFSTPLVTGSVVQMMARNSGLTDKPQTLKAAIKASASYNAGSSMTYVTNSIGSDREGAGVIDADFCYRVAKNGRRTHFDATVNGATTWTYDVYADYTSRPFRIAMAWEVANNTTECTDFDLEVYKNGILVAYSRAWSNSSTYPNTNYEVVSIPTSILQSYGAGYYQVNIYYSGSFNGPATNRIGVAWEQCS